MSQITRCPACQTQFKVVADQLRISDGWVRCGHCQQVFDASLSLQPAPPEPMLPDLPLDQLRGPVTRAAPASTNIQAWGARVPPIAAIEPVDAVSAPDGFEEPDDGFAETQPGMLDAPEDIAAPSSQSYIPSFLKEPALREPAFPALRPTAPVEERAASDGAGSSLSRAASRAGSIDSADKAQSEGTAWHDSWLNSGVRADLSAHPAVPPPTPRGYELPAAEPDEAQSDWPALFDEAPDEVPNAEAVASYGRHSDGAELDLAHFIAEISVSPIDQPLHSSAVAAASLVEISSQALSRASSRGESGDVPDPEDPNWSLVHDAEAPAYASHAHYVEPATLPSPSPAQVAELAAAAAARDRDEAAPSDFELSFVRNARRRVFWAGTGVRVGLALIALGLLLGLLAQMTFRERARLAVAWPQSRVLLESACAYLQCSVGMYRDIGSVMVDGSAFNRVQGDRFQFALTLRSRAALPVETPAIELTLTDAQDQLVLRRVLLPAELAAPNPLSPNQEWSTVAPMMLGQGASRVAGYRVLAFYP